MKNNYHMTTVGQLEEGDMLAHLDHGYVVEVEDAENQVAWIGHGYGALPSNLILVTFHDARGDENYLIMDRDHPIAVEA